MSVQIILSIAIVFYTASQGSSSPGGRRGFNYGLCPKLVVPPQPRDPCANHWWPSACRWWWNVHTESKSEFKPESSSTEKVCCPGYENRTGTCEPRFCVVALRADVKYNKCKPKASGPAKKKSREYILKWKSSTCDKGCREQINSWVAVNCTKSGDLTYHLFPTNSACNNKTESTDPPKNEKYQIGVLIYGIGGGLIGIISFAIIVCTVCIVRRKRNAARNTVNDVAAQSGIPLDYMEENTIYS